VKRPILIPVGLHTKRGFCARLGNNLLNAADAKVLGKSEIVISVGKQSAASALRSSDYILNTLPRDGGYTDTQKLACVM